MATLKPWYYSKTLWVNIVFLFGLFAGKIFGYNITTEEQMAVIIIVNLVLRMFTGTGLTKDKETAEMLSS